MMAIEPPELDLLAAEDAAELLGVKPSTLYAYVSRGLLPRHTRPGSRHSWFDPADLERIRRSDKARRHPRRTAQVGRSEVTSIVEDHLYFRGRDAVELAVELPFEQAVEWLWNPAGPATGAWAAPADLDRWLGAISVGVPELTTPVDRLKITITLAGAADPMRYDLSRPAVLAASRTMLASSVHSLPPLAACSADNGGLASRLWPRLTAAPGDAHTTALLSSTLVVLADHGMAPSTRAVRAAAAVGADPYSVVLTGMNVASGLLHGGSSLAVHALLTDIGTLGRVPVVVADRLRRGDTLPGFGQPRYEGRDPRAELILGRLLDRAPDPERAAAVRSVIELVQRRRGLHPNIEFALGSLCFVHDMVRGAGEAIFSIARSAGWIAHACEEYAAKPELAGKHG